MKKKKCLSEETDGRIYEGGTTYLPMKGKKVGSCGPINEIKEQKTLLRQDDDGDTLSVL